MKNLDYEDDGPRGGAIAWLFVAIAFYALLGLILFLACHVNNTIPQ